MVSGYHWYRPLDSEGRADTPIVDGGHSDGASSSSPTGMAAGGCSLDLAACAADMDDGIIA